MAKLGKFLLCRVFLPLLALSLWAAAPALAAPPADKTAQADALLASPDLDFSKAKEALALYESIPDKTPALLCRMSRACFILGDLAPIKERAGYYEKGLDYSEKALAIPGCPPVEGHYWKAMNLSGLADVGTQMEGFKLLPKIMEELKRVQGLDEAYDEAGVHRVLGRIYFEAPSWPISVGDKEKSLQHLQKAVQLAADNSTNHLYLAETLLDMGKKDEAKVELEKVLQARHNAISPKDLADDQREAKRLLNEMQKD